MAKQTKAYIALLFICIVWGTTYLAIRVGVMHYPALLFAGVRQTIAGIILMIAALTINKRKDLSAKNIARQVLIGFLMLTVGNGCVTWGEQYIPSGIAALVCSVMPLFAVMMNLASSKRDHFNATIGLGLLLGVTGVALIFRQNLADIAKPEYLAGMVAIIIATAGWAVGSAINKKDHSPINAFFNSGMQLFFGGLCMLILSPAIDNYSGMQLWNASGIAAMVYLIIFGSVLAYAAYMYALSKLPVGLATIYAYINPLIAVIVGYAFMQEPLNVYIAMAFVTIALSVYLVNSGYRKQVKYQTTELIAEALPGSVPAET